MIFAFFVKKLCVLCGKKMNHKEHKENTAQRSQRIKKGPTKVRPSIFKKSISL